MICAEEMLTRVEALHAAQNELRDAFDSVDEINRVMDNVDLAIKMISSYEKNPEVCKIVNVDHCLENLMAAQESLIKADAALEALDANKKSVWERFKEGVLRVVKAIKEWFIKHVQTIGSVAKDLTTKSWSLKPDAELKVLSRKLLKEYNVVLYKYSQIIDNLKKKCGIGTGITKTEYRNGLLDYFNECEQFAKDNADWVSYDAGTKHLTFTPKFEENTKSEGVWEDHVDNDYVSGLITLSKDSGKLLSTGSAIFSGCFKVADFFIAAAAKVSGEDSFNGHTLSDLRAALTNTNSWQKALVKFANVCGQALREVHAHAEWVKVEEVEKEEK